MIKLELKHEELDALCLALLDAQEYRKKYNDLGENKRLTVIYETLRQRFRTKEPVTFGIRRLMRKVK